MKSFGSISFAIAVGVLPLLAGCATTTDGKKNTVSVNKGSFETADAKLGNDIQSILAQGGLDTANPSSAPQPAAASDTPKTLSTTATDLKTLVAQLDASSGYTAPAQAVADPKPTTVTAQQTANAARTPALALAETPKTNKGQAQIETTTQTTTLAPIGTPGDLVPIMPPPVVETVREKPRTVVQRETKPSTKTRRVAEQAVSSYKKPTVNRF